MLNLNAIKHTHVWNPAHYLTYESLRLRPALDLLASVPAKLNNGKEISRIADLGCGTGNMVQIMGDRWPNANIVGVDSSKHMLREAQQTVNTQRARFVHNDIRMWNANEAVDLLFCNATLHWLHNHQDVLKHVAKQLAVGGVLAIQMPCNHDAPSHSYASILANTHKWKPILGHVEGIAPVGSAKDYYHMLSSQFMNINIWETTYNQVLKGEDPILQFTRSTTLGPYLNALVDPETRLQFEREYSEEMRRHYPTCSNGITLFPFKRIFIVAEKSA